MPLQHGRLGLIIAAAAALIVPQLAAPCRFVVVIVLLGAGAVQAIGVTNVSRAFWRADVSKEPLQRVYGITFPDKAQLKEYQRRE